ncbi:CDF family Co(II)/Ni(II) efflux transporter DmeF [Corallincola spongiicola]|uniref:Cation transporter n=1 Tax=Corallincola spongiicola TaxID=2520508 RepID=A0ABY1WRG2_9GAMM|nr:CDF family Co(II)/Ni(II) efflux transporter DmeF [Corallincola spongiicola]TAA47316.1 cation transporter [Corallincola spongiicola]
MNQKNVVPSCPKHRYQPDHTQGEKRTWYVLWLTAVTMVIEIIAGTVYGSMALLADGWHMATHVAAFAITLFAYRYATRHAQNATFTFGTGKVSSLGGFASAVALAVVALFMAMESVERLISPSEIRFNEAIVVAIIGLSVNLLSAWLLMGAGGHHHGHDHHGHNHHHTEHHAHNEHAPHGHASHKEHHHDHNLRAAYMHVLADALTSITAILALLAGKWMGWYWMDPLMGIVGAVVISRWALGLLKQTSEVLLDHAPKKARCEAIVEALHAVEQTRVTDLHLWQTAPNQYAAVISLRSHAANSIDDFRARLKPFTEIKHLTIELDAIVAPGDHGGENNHSHCASHNH